MRWEGYWRGLGAAERMEVSVGGLAVEAWTDGEKLDGPIRDGSHVARSTAARARRWRGAGPLGCAR